MALEAIQKKLNLFQMHLDSYISDLLYRYDCVTIPDLGAFLTKQLSAQLDPNTQVFYPPKKQISFNEQIQNNDGLLASYVCEAEKIPYGLAVKNIKKHVRSIKSYLVEGETISLDNIGEIYLNKEGRMVFEPFNQINYLTDAFGLTQFRGSIVEREIHKETVLKIESTRPITLTKDSRKARSYLKYAAVAIVALIIGGAGVSTYYDNQVEKFNEVSQKKANVLLDSKIQEATFVIDSPLPMATLTVNKQSGNYHIVAGAFRVKDNSLKKVEQLRELGYKSREIGVNRYGLHEVVYGSFDSRTEAQKALWTIKRNHNQEAWLLVKALD